MILKGYILTYLYLILIIFISQILNEKLKINKIYTRKFVHIFVSFVWFIMYYYFKGTFHIIIPPLTFIMINILSYKKNIFKGMEEEKSLGTIYYPISVFLMALLTYLNSNLYPFYGIALFCMALGDGLAPIIAKKFKSIIIYNNKTIFGTLAVFIISLLVTILFNIYFKLDFHILKILLIALSTTLLELIGVKGLDNLFLPIGLFIILIITEIFNMYLSILFPTILASFALFKNKITIDGIFLAWIMGIIICSFGGYIAFLALSVLFLLTILSDKIKANKDDKTRNIIQIISNVFTAALCIILYYYTNNNIFYVMYYCVIASSLSDTLASSVGTLSKRKPINIINFRRIKTGESGGVTILGLFISLVGGIIIGLIYLIAQFNITNLILISIMGFTGSFIDSILGILFEVKYKCVKCNKNTDNKIHCNKKTKLIHGYYFIDNNMVNLLSNIFVFLISYFILI